MNSILLTRVSGIALAFFAAGFARAAEPAEFTFSRDIQPLFAEKCLECHGPDKQKGKLRMDDPDSVHRTIDEDEFLYRITTDHPDDRMPPEGERLASHEVEVVKAWVEAGATFETHWAYRPLSSAPPPSVNATDRVTNPIDQFVLARLEKEGLGPSPEADRYTLIKRLHYDLVGLPPTPEAVAAFVNDASPQAYQNLVSQLLGSKHFGERWGRHWLDKARYADSDGYEKDRNRPNAWHYRDWVIEAVNADLPIDQFTVEQLAGDLLPEPGNRQKLATAFHRQTLTNTEGGTDKEEFRVEATFDRTETTGAIWLGLTLNCARCHNHKYDAIEQSEYYQLYSFFDNGEESTFSLPNSEEAMATYRKERAQHDAKIEKLEQRLATAREGHEQAFANWEDTTGARIKDAKPLEFHELADLAVKSDAEGVEFSIENGSIIQVSGANPDGTIVTSVSGTAGSVSQPITGLRLDVLPGDGLPMKGPGRAPNGNFVLNEVEIFLGDRKLPFEDATADYSQGNFEAKNLIDGSTERTSGWAVGGAVGKPHQVDLTLKESVTLKSGDPIRIVLTRNYDGQHTLGRFQLRLTSGEAVENIVPKEIRTSLTKAREERDEKQQKALLDYFLRHEFPPTSPLIAEREALAKKAPKEPATPVAVMTERQDLRETRVLERGSFLTPGEEVATAGLSVLPPIDGRKEGSLDRLDLAHWLMSEENPLPPRVLANHVWEKLFGEGLVRTMNDFGVRGEQPDYPELLDWLGQEYRRLGWSRKQLIETVVLSSTYRQSSAHREDLRDRDPNNHLLARQNRFRVEAEIVRDLSLAVSGLFSDQVGGPSVFPPMPPEVAALSYANNFKWETSKDGNQYRRGMYTFFKRTSPHPNLIAFDCPDSNTTSVQRRTSNTPIQALTTLNNDVYVEVAQAFASRILQLEAKDDRDRIAKALQFCIARPPSVEETQRFQNLLDQSRGYYRSSPESAMELTSAHRPDGIEEEETAAWIAVARIILNLDEFITRE